MASNATDGSYETRWASLFTDPQWLSIDLGASYAVNRVKISWETAMASAYEIQISSNNADWTSIKSVTGNSSATNDQIGLSGTGRYIRIYGTARTTAYGYSIFEVEVYGTVATNVAPTISLTSPISTDDFTAPASITINTIAADVDGTISKVEFYNGAALLTSDATASFVFAWTNVAAGTYSITAKVTDNSGASATSSAVSIRVALPAPLCLPASASGDDGNVAVNVLDNNLATRWSASGDGQWIAFCKGAAVNISGIQIAFYSGNVRQSIFDVQLSRDGLNWANSLTAVHSSGTSLNLQTFTFATQSAKYLRIVGHGNTVNVWNSYTEVKILTGEPPVNQLPSVAITTPTNSAFFNAPASITITATAADLDGTVSKVAFYNGATLLGSDVTAPYAYSLANAPVGTYSLTAVATDNMGATTTSSVVTATVVIARLNQAPSITLNALVKNTSVNAPAIIAITATAADADGTISKVDSIAVLLCWDLMLRLPTPSLGQI
ncbi:MAG: discoidin domain-containing protein [Cytophagaceae bacterium]|nr:discoidin domain-containing protein [Cytophagaceae bacterium]